LLFVRPLSSKTFPRLVPQPREDVLPQAPESGHEAPQLRSATEIRAELLYPKKQAVSYEYIFILDKLF
jgi:hypothetical protein